MITRLEFYCVISGASFNTWHHTSRELSMGVSLASILRICYWFLTLDKLSTRSDKFYFYITKISLVNLSKNCNSLCFFKLSTNCWGIKGTLFTFNLKAIYVSIYIYFVTYSCGTQTGVPTVINTSLLFLFYHKTRRGWRNR